MIKHDMKFINIILPQYHTKNSKIGIQDEKAIMNKVASLPWFIHKHDTRAKHATSIQVSTRRKRKTHYTCVQRLSRAIQSGVENHHFLIIHGLKIKYHQVHVLQPRLHTYTQGDEKDRVLDPKGLASTYMGIQYLVTRVSDALNLSCGLA
jgi:hypothetical protein